MNSKIQTYLDMAAQTACKVTADYTSWTAMLGILARLYKYTFREQLLIFAQRPQATACAEYSLWTERMRRYVKRNAKGIAIVREIDGEPVLHYVFDVADTGTMDTGLHLYFWTAADEFTPIVTATLEQCFQVPADDRGLSVQLATIAGQLAEKYWDTYRDSLPNAIKGSALKKKNRAYKKAFIDAATASITYVLLTRCNLEPDQLFDDDDFAHVYQCDTTDSAMALGDVVSQCSELVLRTIEHEIKQYLLAKQGKAADSKQAQPERPREPVAA